MENKLNERFDLTTLLKQGELNIRSVAASVPIMTAGEYFDMLSELVEKAPTFSDDLRKLINRDGSQSAFKDLSNMIDLLKTLGYEKHAIDFDGILDSYDRGHSRLTSTYAKNIIDDFYGLCTLITDARISQQPESNADDPYGTALKDWVKRYYPENRDKADATRKPVILAVDDSPVVLKSVFTYLGDDYKVYMLAKSYLLEKMLNQIKPDLFLLDYNMPILNGFDLIPIIRNFAEYKDTPIIFLTSEGTLDNVSSAVMLGACDFLSKPVHPRALRERIARHIVKKSEVRENAS